MPVLDKDRLAGMISIGDVLKRHIETIREHVNHLEVSLTEFDLMRTLALTHSLRQRDFSIEDP